MLNQQPLVLRGSAAYYSPGVMEQVLSYRLAVGDVEPCEHCLDVVALRDAEHLGKRVWLELPNGKVLGPLLVVDCARSQDKELMDQRGRVIELSWELAQMLEMRGPLAGVVVYFASPQNRWSGPRGPTIPM